MTTDTQPTATPTRLIGLLDAATELLADHLHARLEEHGYRDIRYGHGCVFGNIGPDGSRLTDLAQQAGLTKQAVGEVVADLERLGYVKRTPDPADGRAKIITLTERGRRAQDIGTAALEGLEERWAERYGRERMAVMRELLEEIIAAEGRPRRRA